MIAEPARKHLDLAPLKRGMRHHEIRNLPPAVVRRPGQGWMLLAGERRWIVSKELGRHEVISIQSWADFLAWMILDLEDQQANQGAYVVMPHDVVSAAFATNRILSNLRATKNDFGPRTTAEYLGCDFETVATARTVLKFLSSDLSEIVETTKTGLDQVRKGEMTPSGVHSRIKLLEGRLRRPRSGGAEQRKVLDNLANVVTSINHELDQIGQLSDQLSPQDCQRWLDGLLRLNSRSYQLRRALRERINGGSDIPGPGGEAGNHGDQ